MSDLLTHLAARALDVPPNLAPRSASMFEPSLPDARDALLPELELEVYREDDAALPLQAESRASSPMEAPLRVPNEAAARDGAWEPPAGDHASVEHVRQGPIRERGAAGAGRRDADMTSIEVHEEITEARAHVEPGELDVQASTDGHDAQSAYEAAKVLPSHGHRAAAEPGKGRQRESTKAPLVRPSKITPAGARGTSSGTSSGTLAGTSTELSSAVGKMHSRRRADGPSTARPAFESQVADVEPSITISIGRIDVRAAATPTETKASRPGPAPVMTLENYLRQRSQRSGS